MNKRLEKMRENILNGEYNKFRDEIKTEKIREYISEKLYDSEMADFERNAHRFEYLMSNETPVILPGEKTVFLRTITKIPEIYSEHEMKLLKDGHYMHEAGYVCNICPNYEDTIKYGLNHTLSEIERAIEITSDNNKKRYGENLKKCVAAIIDLSDRYAEKAEDNGFLDVARILKKIPRNGAETFREALQFFRILHFSLWLSGSYHNTIGRFDQYMYQYYKSDIEQGKITKDEALELLEEFFITFNKDSGLYVGVQQGDNGQSMVLGGYVDKDTDGFNELSELCLTASLNVKLIDPKINLRVNKLTAKDTYIKAVHLTKQGLGFPQYSNDDVVIDGLTGCGYDYGDAENYVTAACWEFIIPGCAMDIPNIGAVSFVRVVNKCVNEYLAECRGFEEFFGRVREEIKIQLESELSRFKKLYIIPAPVMTLLHNENFKNLTDISLGGKYNNFGIHGTGIANAVDSLYAVKKHIFDDKDITVEELIKAINTDFKENIKLRNILKYNTAKMGDGNDETDNIAVELLDTFADELKKYKNERGGIYKGGTGSAMYYIWHSKDEGSSADGRIKGEPLSANFSPSLDIGSKNIISVIKSFTKPDMKKVINGGPLTLELHDTIFRNDEAIEKTALLISEYIKRGGHQLQINAVNREKLIKAKSNPEQYRNLIVRVWGWSGYFVELDEEYQNQIINRTEYTI